jgi:hypothetical protein
MKEAMRKYFDRLMASYAAAGKVPRCERDPDAEPLIYDGEPDANAMVAWHPVEKNVQHDLDALAPDLAPQHDSIQQYFNSWWFCSLEGKFQTYGLSLMSVVPGIELDSFLLLARGYKDAHNGVLAHVPIGVEFNGLQVVVSNSDGAVFIEDWERGTFISLAAGLETLIDNLQV